MKMYFLQWDITQLLRKIKFAGKLVELDTVILGEITQTHKTDVAYFICVCSFLKKDLFIYFTHMSTL